MRLFKLETIKKHCEKDSTCRNQLLAWSIDIKEASWSNFNELKGDYPSAKILGENRVCFKIKGNSYRLVTEFNFEHQVCSIKFIGTHAQYDKIDPLTVNQY